MPNEQAMDAGNSNEPQPAALDSSAEEERDRRRFSMLAGLSICMKERYPSRAMMQVYIEELLALGADAQALYDDLVARREPYLPDALTFEEVMAAHAPQGYPPRDDDSGKFVHFGPDLEMD